MTTINKLPFSNQFERGHSFNWAGDWKVGRYYYNDEYVTDFVVYDSSVVLSCRENHTATEETEPELIYDESGKVIGVDSIYWSFVLQSEVPSMKLEIALNNTIINDPTGTVFTSGTVYDELEYLFDNPDKCIIKFDIDTTPPGMLGSIRRCFYCDNKDVNINFALDSGTSTISYTSLLYYNNSFNVLILNIEKETGTTQHQDETIWYIRFTVSYTINTL